MTKPHEARRHFHRRTPWLFFHRDHPLRSDTLRERPRDRESYDDQVDRLWDILVLPDDYWPDDGDDGATPVRIGIEM